MQTGFTSAQLADPAVAASDGIVRACVHCGFCSATCPTYLLLGDELDSPRGRIVLIKEMLEGGGTPAAATVKHIDRCLDCLSCNTTCPSGVDYGHLVDHARAHIEEHYHRPLGDRLLRHLLAFVLPHRRRFRVASRLGRFAASLAPSLPKRLAAMVRAAPPSLPQPGMAERAGVFAAVGERRGRVALLSGCIQPALRPAIDDSAIRLLTRHGIEVVITHTGCCGALAHHIGKDDAARNLARANIAAWDDPTLDAVLTTTSGCGSQMKDYATLFRGDAAWHDRAARVSAKVRDISEYLATLPLAAPVIAPGMRVAYHSACSLQHGQSAGAAPRRLLAAAGFDVAEIGEAHICCGSAGTYSILQPDLAGQLRDRKLSHIATTGAAIVATTNIGCMSHLGGPGGVALVHTVELLDWATGGPCPAEVTALSTGHRQRRPRTASRTPRSIASPR